MISLLDFKEVIRKEVVGKIATAVDQLFKPQRIRYSNARVAFDGIQDEGEGSFEDSYFSDEEEGKYLKKFDQSNSSSSHSSLFGNENKLITRKTTFKKKKSWKKMCCNICKKTKRLNLLNRGTTYRIYGDKNVMTKVDLFYKNEIIDEAVEKECHEIKVDDSGRTYIFEDYASRIYKNIRRIYDINDSDFNTCFGSKALPDLDVKISSGKGGAFFVKNQKHSHLLIKSITPGEYEIFKQFSDKYYMYLLNNPKTLLTPIFGIFTIALSENNEIPDIHFIVMKSVFDANLVSPHQKMCVFDLKGSEHGRKSLNPNDYDAVRDIRTCPIDIIKPTIKDIDFKNIFESLNIDDSTGRDLCNVTFRIKSSDNRRRSILD